MSEEIESITIELKDRYNVTCSECNHEFSFSPSMAMMMKFNTGHGSCPQCKKFLRLKINQENNTGISELFSKNLPTLERVKHE
jgi:ssDNA-binding Zn-finger/Zn-ribbon topoisomerase 1